ncbi:MAG TPA: type II secretion system protein [bacterium]|nr:type II secretion system protein [bacterium]HPT30005.1 type II secretion system protein [bacterium]
MKNIRKKSGFTLIELLLYSALSGVIILAVSSFVFIIWQAQAKSQSISEVEQQGIQIMDNILRQVRNANAINSPTLTNTAAVLSLATSTPAANPIVIDQSGNYLRQTLGANPAVLLNNDRVVVSNLSFSNYGRTGTNGSIRVKFTLTHINPGGKNEYNYSQTFYGTASGR